VLGGRKKWSSSSAVVRKGGNSHSRRRIHGPPTVSAKPSHFGPVAASLPSFLLVLLVTTKLEDLLGSSWCGVRICTGGYDLQVRYRRCTPNLKRYSTVLSPPESHPTTHPLLYITLNFRYLSMLVVNLSVTCTFSAPRGMDDFEWRIYCSTGGLK